MSEQKAIAAFNEFCYRSGTQGLDIPKCTREEWIACWNLATKNAERHVPEPWRKAVVDLVFAARTSGGVAGMDDALCAACDAVEALLETPSAPAPLPRSERARYACKVCGNIPDEQGMISHGRGCYTQSADGGGESYVEFEFKYEPPIASSSAAGWIDEPKEPGWYWFRGVLYGEERTEPVHVFVRPGHEYLCIWDPAASAYGKSNYFHVGRLGAKWYGPITAPDGKEKP